MYVNFAMTSVGENKNGEIMSRGVKYINICELSNVIAITKDIPRRLRREENNSKTWYARACEFVSMQMHVYSVTSDKRTYHVCFLLVNGQSLETRVKQQMLLTRQIIPQNLLIYVLKN